MVLETHQNAVLSAHNADSRSSPDLTIDSKIEITPACSEIASIGRMATEILGEIFLCTLPSFRDVVSIKKCPWVLTHVCSRWRAVAVTLPSLWSLLVFNFAVQPHYSREMIHIQIQRARFLEIHFSGNRDDNPPAQIALFGLLANYAARWQELDIHLPSYLVPLLNPRDLTALRRARLSWDSTSQEFNVVDFFQMATSLVDITVSCGFRFAPNSLPTLRLTRYDGHCPWITHSALLKLSPNLQEVRIEHHFREEWPEPGEPIVLLHLRRLFVKSTRSLDYLKAPNLEEIAIDVVTDGSENGLTLERFMMRSSCSPRSLCLGGPVVKSMASILQRHPSITEVKIFERIDPQHECDVLSTFLVLSSDSDCTSSASLLPHITSISFVCDHGDFHDRILRMLESRWNAADCSLRAAEILILYLECLDAQSMAKIATLQAAGLQIKVCDEEANDLIDRWYLLSDWH
ncbi:Beta-lactamase domain-containing protein [Mycena sanguinolenta]|uniref:Beta-lactamase domain-containing protein n=1 Tax=Mycena sanguinolenta TaxID=230812 RepID=A0A8H6ZBM8_9AGAR|nr:Beta-lactamase domain-containing protein [Mycena sanguinolenta]